MDLRRGHLSSPSPKTSRESSPFGRIWSNNNSELDRIDAIPSAKSNVADNNIVIDGLCSEDQLYLQALAETTDSSENEDWDGDQVGPGSKLSNAAWSGPMVQTPVVMNKRIRKMRTPYAITMSLEDISYMRPSWNLSKGLTRVEIDKRKQKLNKKGLNKGSGSIRSLSIDGSNSSLSKILDNRRLTCYLILLTIVVLILTFPPIFIERHRHQLRMQSIKMRLVENERLLELFRPVNQTGGSNQAQPEPIFRLHFGQNIPLNLKPEHCNCEQFKKEPKVANSSCIACLDWAYRANLRIFIERNPQLLMNNNVNTNNNNNSNKSDSNQFCYHIKWQNYNTWMPPLVDCISIDDEHWFGLGDMFETSWPFTKLDFDWKPLKSNLTRDLVLGGTTGSQLESSEDKVSFGSYVNLTLISSNRISLGNLRTDFELMLKLNRDLATGRRQFCMSATCTDLCTETWQREDHLNRLRWENNIFEYTICSANSIKQLAAKQLSDRTRDLRQETQIWLAKAGRENNNRLPNKSARLLQAPDPASSGSNLLDANSGRLNSPFAGNQTITLNRNFSRPTNNSNWLFPEEIGLLERVMFTTSMEFFPYLDEMSLRDHVESITKLSLNSSLTLSIDTRWQTHEGSFKLNDLLFPDAQLTLEWLRGQNFKVIFAVKPYLDSIVGVKTLNELLESGRLYPVVSVDHKLLRKSDQRRSEELVESGAFGDGKQIQRRDSFFRFRNQSILIRGRHGDRFPHIFQCKESVINSCALFDLTKVANRNWLIASLKSSEIFRYGMMDGIRISGVHSNFFAWQTHFRSAISELTKELFYRERLFAYSRFSGDLGYVELAPRPFSWSALRSNLNSVLNLGMMGFSLVHPGSVWGDLRLAGSNLPSFRLPHQRSWERTSDEELANRWLQLYTFMGLLQFNNLRPIYRFQLQSQLRDLVNIRQRFVVPQLKQYLPFTPLVKAARREFSISNSVYNLTRIQNGTAMLPVIRPVWMNPGGDKSREVVLAEQFIVGQDILVAPILAEGQRQRDIFLPEGIWRDELKQVSREGGKWLSNYRVELDQIAWFTSLNKTSASSDTRTSTNR